MIKVVTNIEELQNYQEQWNIVFNRCEYAIPFQSFDFTIASIRYLNWHDAFLYIILVLDDRTKDIKAILPTNLTKRGILEFINQGYLDFCTIIVEPSYDNYSLYEEIGNYINSDKNINVVDFMNVKIDSPLLSSLKPFVKNYQVCDCSYYSKSTLCPQKGDKDFVDSYKSLNSKKKKNLRTDFLKLGDKSNLVLLNSSNGDKFPDIIIKDLADYMIAGGLRTKEYFSEDMLLLWHYLYEHNILSLAILYYDNDVKSCNLIYNDSKHKEIIKWIMLYKDNKWNKAINILLSEMLYKQGGYTINFARGIYDYKLVNFHPDVNVLFRIRIYKSKNAVIRNCIIDCLKTLKRAICSK